MSELRVDNIKNRTGGALGLPGGAVVTGVVTATSFSGDASGLTGVASTDNIITGTAATFNNLVNVGSNIKIDAASGIVTATSFNDAGGSIKGVGIATADGTVGTGVTLIDFRNSGISTVTVSSGIATVQITGGGGGGLNAVNFVLSI